MCKESFAGGILPLSGYMPKARFQSRGSFASLRISPFDFAQGKLCGLSPSLRSGSRPLGRST